MRLETAAERDVGDRGVGVNDPPRRPFHPQSPHELHRRLADHTTEDAVEVERGQTCLTSEGVEVQRGIEVRDGMIDDALHDLDVPGTSLRFHSAESTTALDAEA